jgi:glycosyltransferase involved in cell wall biosynthesis
MLFSIVVATYNRAATLDRSLASVLTQSFADYELILVDDASTDDTPARLRSFTDPRVRILFHEQNLGTGPARNTGVAAARGDWIVFVDSDDELVPGALGVIADLIGRAPPEVAALWFRCRMDDGGLSPPQLNQAQFWDYAGFVRFWSQSSGQWRDMLYCTRRACFAELPQPGGRKDDTKFLIDFAQRHRIWAHPDVLRLYHQDAGNQLVEYTRRLHPRRDQAFIVDRANAFRDLLRDHESFVAREGPRLYLEYLESASTTATMANRRIEAAGYALKLIRLAPGRMRNWMLLGASLIGPFSAVIRRWATAKPA